MIDISVIVPVWRPCDFESLYISMSGNTGNNIEWIVVNDGSGSEFNSVFKKVPKGVKLVHLNENRRQGAARNVGLTEAKGDWIKFLDAGDILDAGHLVELYAAAGYEKTIPFASTKHIFANGQTSVNKSWRNLALDSHAQFRRQLVRPFLSHCGALFPRNLLATIGGYDESLVTDEDGDLLLRILRAGYHFIPVENVYYHYIHHQGVSRVSADDDIRKMQARNRVCDKIENDFAGQIPLDVAEALAQRMDKIAMSYWVAFPSEAKVLLSRAQQLAPGYQPDMRFPLRLIRSLFGPSAVFFIQSMYRQLKGYPKGGAQG